MLCCMHMSERNVNVSESPKTGNILLEFRDDLELRHILDWDTMTAIKLGQQARCAIALGIVIADWVILGKVPPLSSFIKS